jgi:predicted RNA-binding protein (virulence factor B family)
MKKTQNYFLELGLTNTLLLDRLTTPGAYLMAQDGNDVLLPGQYLTPDMKEGDLLDVFLYTDSEDRLVATTQTPKAKLDEFAALEIVDIAPFGAFLDWGLPKDLLLPKKLQKTTAIIGEKRFVKVVYDERTHRLIATEKLGDFFEKKVQGLHPHQEVSIIILTQTPLGYKCLVENKYEGLIYHNEIFENITIGEHKKAYVKTLRKDGNIDLTLRKAGSKKSVESTQKILKLLQQNKGIMPYNSKSDPSLIKDVFGMSKKEFKASLTQLKNDNKIEVKDTGIYIKE